MHPVCSLRVKHIQFKHASAEWASERVLQAQGRSTAWCRARPTQRRIQEVLLPRRVACSDAAVPNIPLPGDNQSAAIFAALSIDESYESSSDDELADTHHKSSSNHKPPPPDDKPKFFIPHRWRVVGMMALAFVLCNMDKVRSIACCTACILYCLHAILFAASSQPSLTCQGFRSLLHAKGEHVSCCHTHGRRAGLECNRSRPGVFCLLLGLCLDTNSSRLHLHQVSSSCCLDTL